MRKLLLSALLVIAVVLPAFAAVKVSIWHGYRGEEKRAIEEVAKMYNVGQGTKDGVQVSLLAVSFDALNDKLRMEIPNNKGPDVFIFAQDYVGGWAESEIILPLEKYLDKATLDQYFPNTLDAFEYMYPGSVWALPGSFKNIALYYNKNLVRNPPQKMSEIITAAKNFTNPKAGALGRWGFVYETGNFYFHTMWVQGFGGRIFRNVGKTKQGYPIFLPLLYSDPMIKAGYYVNNNVIKQGVCPLGPGGTLVTQLFNTGNAMFVISGQWFRGEIDKRINYGLSELPFMDKVDANTVSAPGSRAIPFLTVEGYFMASCARNQQAAVKVIKFFTSKTAGKVMAKIGKQTPANALAYEYPEVSGDEISQIFRKASKVAKSMPNSPEMALTWDPATSGLNDILGGAKPEDALKRRQIQLMKSIEQLKGAGIFSRYQELSKPLSVN